MKKLFIYPAICLILCCLTERNGHAMQNGNYFFERISPESGFAFDAVYTIAEDCNGLVWFGCNNGLYYYNTHEIEKVLLYPNNASIPQAVKVNKILTDDQCRMWICTEVGLYSLQPGQNDIMQVHFDSNIINFPNHSVEDILQWDSTTFLVLINRTLFIYNIANDTFQEIKNESFPIKETISYLGRGRNEEVLIGTTNGKLFISREGRVSEYSLLYEQSGIPVRSVCVNGDSYLIGFDGSGVNVITTNGTLIEAYHEDAEGNYKLPSNRVRQIIRRPNGQIWIGTYGGLLVISPGSRQIIRNDGINGLPYNSIYALYQGKNDGIWVGTWAGGIAYFNEYNYRFQHIRHIGNSLSGDRAFVSSITEDYKGNIWIGSEDGGVSVYNPLTNMFHNEVTHSQTSQLDRIKTLYSHDGINLLIGTFNMGFWHYNIDQQSIRHIHMNIPGPEINYSSIIQIENELWIGTRGRGIIYYNMVTSEKRLLNFERLFPELPSLNWIWHTFRDSENGLWICTDNGLLLKPDNSSDFINYLQNDSIFGLSNNIIYTIYEDKDGIFWFGTRGKGMFTLNHRTSEIKPFIHNEIIANSDVYSILEDDHNNIWFSTNNGIFRFDPAAETLRRFTAVDGLSGDQFIPKAAIKSSDGRLYFGSSNGFNIVDPRLIRNNPAPPGVFLSKILVNNHPYEFMSGENANKFYIPGIKELHLRQNNNSLTFGFASNCFIKPSKTQFRYRLLNYMNEWTIIENGRDISFTKIPPGHYTLEVYGSNNDNIWSEQPLRIPIRIHPPIWLSWYAYIGYFLIGSILIYFLFKESKIRIQMRKDIMAERFKNEASKTINDEKIKFFTNISHEFRTPLTLIVSPINNLLNKFQYDQTTAKQLKTIKRNADRLSRLTNQVLDFRLLEAGQIHINPKKVDIVEICTNIIDCFEFQITEKKINFIFSSDHKSYWLMLDPEMTEKIVYNLLSNAFKFSQEKSQILFSIEKKDLDNELYIENVYTGNRFLGEALEIKIRDFGVGIPPSVLPTIFERFTKAPDNRKTGSGIGLHMCQEYARLNNANIMVQSEPGKGSTFILNIPYKKCSWNKKENFIMQPHFDKLEQKDVEIIENKSTIDHDTVILIVEDNDDLRIYFKNFLSTHYRVLTAKNGTQGLEIALEVIPNIIITDIMMPGIDGLELTEAIKSNKKTSFIPVIILTAMSESDYQKQGLMKGADSFLVKPIDEYILMAQIQNILRNRQSLQRIFNEESEKPNKNNRSLQLSFIEQAEQIVLEQLQQPDFNITELASKLNVSHSSLHRKIKTSVNQSPTEFIRDLRLKKAIKLMKDDKYTMDEISSYVGFNSASYFMRSFKRKYGKTPKEYRRNVRETETS